MNNNVNNNHYNNKPVKNSGIRGFDIGNNAKYGKAQQMARNTTPLPSSFWESDGDDDSDSYQEKKETNDIVANRWKAQKSNIKNGPINMNHDQNTNQNIKQIKPLFHGVYEESSSEDDDGDDDFDEFEKYIPPKPNADIIEMERKKKEEDYWKNNNTKWIVHELNKQWEYDTIWFQVEKMRNGKANGKQMRPFMEKSGLSHDELKKIWKLSDLDKDGKMGNEEFSLCMLLMEETKSGKQIPNKLAMNYIPPSFRGKPLVKTPPKKQVIQKSVPPKISLNTNNKPFNMNINKSGGYNMSPKQKQIMIKPSATTHAVAPNMNESQSQQQNKGVVKRQIVRQIVNTPNNGRNTGNVNNQRVGDKHNVQQTQYKKAMPKKQAHQKQHGQEQETQKAFGNNNNNNNGNRTNRTQQQESGQYIEMDLEEIKDKSIETAKKAGKQAKKAGIAALGWMTKKMTELNDKVQEQQNDKATNGNNQNNVNKKTY